MALCLECRQYNFKPEDRYCAHCGCLLAKLELENNGQVDIPLDTNGNGKVEVEAFVRNAGLADLQFDLLDPSEPDIVTVLSTRSQALKALDQPTPIALWLDVDAMKKREIKLLSIPFTSTDPSYPTGNLIITNPVPGEIIVSEEKLNIDAGNLNRTGPGITAKRRFTIPMENTGGGKVKITIGVRPTNPEYAPIQVALADGEETWIRGYETKEVEFFAWSEVAEDKPIDDQLEILFEGVRDDAAQDRLIRLKAEIVSPPEPVLETVDFGKLLPKQIKPVLVTLRNRGSQPFKIKGIHSDDPRVIHLTRTPITVSPGDVGSTLELLFSTRFSDNPEHEHQGKLTGSLTLETDIHDSAEYHLYWEAKIHIPEQGNGILSVDFGTVNSCVAYYDLENDPVIIKENEGSKGHIPSMLVFRGRDVFITGKRALEEKARVPAECVVHSLKRSLQEPEREIYGKSFRPGELATLIIEQLLLEAAHRHNCLPEKIAVAVPANFWGPIRHEIIEACKRAWDLTEPKVVVVDEPTAVAMYYVYKNRSQFHRIRKPRHILVFDFGGGTLDISIVEIRKNKSGAIEVGPIIARGDNQMGGIDLDVTLLKHFVDRTRKKYDNFDDIAISSMKSKFEQKYKRREQIYNDLRSDRFSWIDASCITKEELSEKENVQFQIDVLRDEHGERLRDGEGKPKRFSASITRKRFNQIIRNNIKRAEAIVVATLEHCSLKPENINVVLLTGLSSKIPYVREVISGLFPKAKIPSKDKFPLKTSVACGAAIAAYRQGLGGDKSIKVLNLEHSSYRYGYLEPEGIMGSRFVQLIDVDTAFKDSRNTGKLKIDRSDQWQMIEIAQHAGSDDHFDELPPEVTILGKIDLLKYVDADYESDTVELAMSFSELEGKLSVEVNGKLAKLDPYLSAGALESTYL